MTINLILDFENEFDLALDPKELEGLKTVGDVYDIIVAKLQKGPAKSG